ncbi:MAG: SDR family oxidoreductase [Nitrospinae bacterium]|nr:SDR family oxidoreductase [Nitrospinota bacterium]
MENKTCLITGATSGIGKATALGIAEHGAQLLLVARNPEKGERVRSEIITKTGNKKIELLYADLSSQRQINALAETIYKNYSQIDILINNAGGVWGKRELTEDGIEKTWAVNHLAYFLFTRLMEKLLKSTPNSRVINVSSDLHERSKLRLDDPQFNKGYSALNAYGHSKLANIMITYEFARRWKGSGVTVNCVHPGGVATKIGYGGNWFIKLGWWLMLPTLISEEEGAKTTIYLATSTEVAGISGKYFVKQKAIKSSPESYDEKKANALWELSEQMVELA